MKKTIIIMSSFIFMLLVSFIVIVSFSFGLESQYDKSFYGGMKIKYNRLKEENENKVVIVGGSSVAFGLRSDLLEEELGMPVINFGLYANLGTKYMLDVAEDFIKEGDIIIIAPEQNNQALSMYFNGEATWYSMDGNFDILKHVKKDNYSELASSFLKFTSNKFNYWKDNNKPDPEGVYNVKSFNEYGDISYERLYNTMNNGFDESTLIGFEKDIIDVDFIKYLNNYNDVLSNRGAKVYYSFSPMNEKALDKNYSDDEYEEYYDYLNEVLDFSIIGNPKTHILDYEWFYDSNFHLNNLGSVYYTAIMAQEIKAQIDDFSPMNIELPEKPKERENESTEIGKIEDLDEAAKIFNLTGVTIKTNGGKTTLEGKWEITGLTDYGKTLNEIIIPDELAGVAVAKIGKEAFNGNTNLSKITFGKNISEVGLYAFMGCSNLKAIYITTTDPSIYHVSSTVLDGLNDCYFYIPKSASNDYKMDYFWGYISDYLRTYE